MADAAYACLGWEVCLEHVSSLDLHTSFPRSAPRGAGISAAAERKVLRAPGVDAHGLQYAQAWPGLHSVLLARYRAKCPRLNSTGEHQPTMPLKRARRLRARRRASPRRLKGGSSGVRACAHGYAAQECEEASARIAPSPPHQSPGTAAGWRPGSRPRPAHGRTACRRRRCAPRRRRAGSPTPYAQRLPPSREAHPTTPRPSSTCTSACARVCSSVEGREQGPCDRARSLPPPTLVARTTNRTHHTRPRSPAAATKHTHTHTSRAWP